VTPEVSPEPVYREEPPPEWIVAAPGVRMRPLVEGVGTKLFLYQIDPGTRFEDHRHEFGELGVVLQGLGRITLEGAERELRAGESYFLPPNCLHGLSVPEGTEPMVLIDVVTFLPSDVPTPPLSAMAELTSKVVRRSSKSHRD
jgi:quercetin dioxygenase-like cupin family protein